MHIGESILDTFETNDGTARSNMPSPLNDLALFIRNHELRCDCDSRAPRLLPDHRTDELRHLLPRISYRDWLISLKSPCNASSELMIAVNPGPNEVAKNSISVPLCPKMTDEFVIDLLFEMIKHIEAKSAYSRFTLAA